MSAARAVRWLGVDARAMRPTQNHRPAVWEAMLGTVTAMSPEGEIRNFDYDYDGALAFAGVEADRDPRVARVRERYTYGRSGATWAQPRYGQSVLWVLR